MTCQSHNTSTIRVAKAIKLARIVTYLKKLPPKKLVYPLAVRSCKIMWQIKTIIFPLPQCLLPLTLVRWWLTMISSHNKVARPFYHMSLQYQTKLNPLYPLKTLSKPTISINTMLVHSKLGKVVTFSQRLLPPLKWHNLLITRPTGFHIKIWKICISTFTGLMITKLGRVLFLRRGFTTQTFNLSLTSWWACYWITFTLNQDIQLIDY